MKKGYVLPCGLLFFLLLTAIWSGHLIGIKVDVWCVQIRTAGQLAQQENWAAAEDTLEKSHADWSAHQIWLRITVRHDMVDDAEELYRRSMSFAKTQESDEFQAEIAGLLTKLTLLAEAERLSLQNVL